MRDQYGEIPITLLLIAIAEGLKLYGQSDQDKPLLSFLRSDLDDVFPGFLDSEGLTDDEQDQALGLRDLFLRLLLKDQPSSSPH